MRYHEKTQGVHRLMVRLFGAAGVATLLTASAALAADSDSQSAAIAQTSKIRPHVVELDLATIQKLLEPDSTGAGAKGNHFFITTCEGTSVACQKALDEEEVVAAFFNGVKKVDFYHLDPVKEAVAYEAVQAAIDPQIQGEPNALPISGLWIVDGKGAHLAVMIPNVFHGYQVMNVIRGVLQKEGAASKEQGKDKDKPL